MKNKGKLKMLFFDMLTKRDARLLRKWWDVNSPQYEYTIRRSPTNSRFWALYRSSVA